MVGDLHSAQESLKASSLRAIMGTDQPHGFPDSAAGFGVTPGP
jgi:hypothetical protein